MDIRITMTISKCYCDERVYTVINDSYEYLALQSLHVGRKLISPGVFCEYLSWEGD